MFVDFHAIGEKLLSFLCKKIKEPHCEHLPLRFAIAGSENQTILDRSISWTSVIVIEKVSD